MSLIWDEVLRALPVLSRLATLLDIGAVGVGVLEVLGSKGPELGPGQEDRPAGQDDQARPEVDVDPGGKPPRPVNVRHIRVDLAGAARGGPIGIRELEVIDLALS
jgi:hypothetical protein